MRITPYLTFDGRCAEAFRFYQELLGGSLEMMTHGESPIADEVPPDQHDRVLHASLTVGDHRLMASDAPPEQFDEAQGLSVSLQVETPDEADRIFEALAEDGTVTMPIQKTFWTRRFGMVVDRFGTPWMIGTDDDGG